MNLRLSAANLKGAASQTFRKSVAAFAIALASAFALPAHAIYSDSFPLCKSAVAIAAPLTTNEEIVAICTVPAGAMSNNAILRISAAYSYTNSANSKTFRVRYSGIAGTTFFSAAATTTAFFSLQGTIQNRGATNSQASWWIGGAAGSWTSGAAGITTGIIDTTAVTTVVITCQKALGSEACTLENYFVELIGGGT